MGLGGYKCATRNNAQQGLGNHCLTKLVKVIQNIYRARILKIKVMDKLGLIYGSLLVQFRRSLRLDIISKVIKVKVRMSGVALLRIFRT